jgi:transposase
VIQITPQMRILVATEPQDFRRGIDGMAKVCRQQLSSDPFSGTAYVFRNRRGTAVKILVYDGQGFWLCHKRLSTGRFSRWPSGDHEATSLQAHELSVLLFGGDWLASRGAPVWRSVSPGAVGATPVGSAQPAF